MNLVTVFDILIKTIKHEIKQRQITHAAYKHTKFIVSSAYLLKWML